MFKRMLLIFFFSFSLCFLVYANPSEQQKNTQKENRVKDSFATKPADIEQVLTSARTIFLVESEITEDIAPKYMKELLYLDKKEPGKTINLFIESNGGNGAVSIANFIKTLKSPVNTYCLDMCHSGATMLLAAGTGKRYAFRFSRIGIHITNVTAENDRGLSGYQTRERLQKMYEDFWKKYARLPPEFLPFNKEFEVFFTSEEALKFGIIDEIIEDGRGQYPKSDRAVIGSGFSRFQFYEKLSRGLPVPEWGLSLSSGYGLEADRKRFDVTTSGIVIVAKKVEVR